MGNIEWLPVEDLPVEKVGEDGVLAWFIYGRTIRMGRPMTDRDAFK